MSVRRDWSKVVEIADTLSSQLASSSTRKSSGRSSPPTWTSMSDEYTKTSALSTTNTSTCAGSSVNPRHPRFGLLAMPLVADNMFVRIGRYAAYSAALQRSR